MRNRAQLVAFGRLTDGPASFPKDFGSVEIRVRSIAAGATQKLGLGRSVQLLGVSTLRTLAAGIARIDRYHRDASGSALVCNKEFELIERPRMQYGTMRQPSLEPLSNAFEVFEDNGAVRAFGFRNDLLGNAVVYIFGETGFAARQILEKATTTVRAFLLQFGAKMAMTMTDAFYFRPAKAVAIGVGKDFRNAKIATEKIVRRRGYGSIFAQHQVDVHLFASMFQRQRSRSGFLALEKMSLIIAQREFNLDSAIDGRQADRLRLFDKAKQGFIEVCAACLKAGGSFLTFAKAGGNAGNGADGIIAGQAIFRLDAIVAKFVQGKLLAHILTIGNGQNVVASSRELFQRGKQRLSLFFSGFEFTTNCFDCTHELNVPLRELYFNKKGRCEGTAA